MYKSVIFILLSLSFDFCNGKAGRTNANEDDTSLANILTEDVRVINADTLQEDIEQKILDKVEKLPEVKKLELYIDSISNHKRGVSMMIISKPNKEQKYYHIQVGYNGSDRFVVYFNFYVFTKDFEIKYYDAINDSVLSIEEWRKERKERKNDCSPNIINP